MSENASSRVALVEQTIHLLTRARHELSQHDYAIAQVMVGVASQMLTDLQGDLEQHLTLQRTLRQVLNSARSEA